MRESFGAFPFGEPLRPVVQLDRGPKDVFVLGVYSVSAVRPTRRNRSSERVRVGFRNADELAASPDQTMILP